MSRPAQEETEGPVKRSKAVQDAVDQWVKVDPPQPIPAPKPLPGGSQ